MNAKLIHNFFSLSILQVANIVLPLATVPYLLRVLGPGQFGAITFCQAIVTYLVLLAEYGFNYSATAQVARLQSDRRGISEVFWATQAAKALMGCGGLIVLLLAVALVPRLSELRVILFATYPMVLGAILFPQWLFQGLERMILITFCVLGARAIVIPLTFLLVRSHDDAWIAALLNSTSLALAGVFAILLIARHGLVGRITLSRASVVNAFREGWHAFLSTAAVSLYTTSNSVILGILAGNAAVGYFAAADKIRIAAQSVIGPLSDAVYPRINALFAEDGHRAYSLIRKLLCLQACAMLLLSIVLFFGAGPIVRLVMGHDFEKSVDVLRCMALIPFLVALSNVMGVQTMLPLGMKEKFSQILLCSGAFNIVILVPLVLLYSEKGAALSVLATESLVTISMARYLRKKEIPVFQLKTQQK